MIGYLNERVNDINEISMGDGDERETRGEIFLRIFLREEYAQGFISMRYGGRVSVLINAPEELPGALHVI